MDVFVKGRSCLTNLIEFFKEVTKMIDEDRAMDVVYMDFSKAFDKVPHGRLVQKVKSHGIRDELARWIQNWLGQRSKSGVVKTLTRSKKTEGSSGRVRF